MGEISDVKKELIVITGGSRGIGKAILSLINAQNEYDAVVIARNHDCLKGVNASYFFDADLRNVNEINSVATRILGLNLPLKALINNAGFISDEHDFLEADYETLLESMTLHCFAPLLMANLLLPMLKKTIGSTIINIGSIYGSISDHTIPAYALSKSPIPLLTTMMARAYAPDVRVNCVLPGHVDTRMTKSAPREFIEDVIFRTPLKRLATAEEIAKLVMFLLGNDAAFITGSSIRVDGGFWATIQS